MADARPEAIVLVGAAIRRAREEQGMPLLELASRASVSYQYLSGIENGKQNFSMRILERIGEALGLPVPDLIRIAYSRV